MKRILAGLVFACLLASPGTAQAEEFPHTQILNGDSNQNGTIVVKDRTDNSYEQERYIANAIYDWGSLYDSHGNRGVNMRQTYGAFPRAEVIIRDGECSDEARADFPTPLYDSGPTVITLCPAFYRLTSDYYRRSVVSHELGHTVGLSHLSYRPEYEGRTVMFAYGLYNDPDRPGDLDVGAWERRWLDGRSPDGS